MDKIDILIWIQSAGFAILFGLLIVIWNAMNHRFDKTDQRFDKVDQRIDKLDEKVNDIDKRICRLEGSFASKDCCMIKDDRQNRKALE